MLDTPALVHETYIRFLGSSALRSEDRRSFFKFASQVMRNVIVDTARARLAQRRGGGAAEMTLSTQLLDHLPSGESSILEVHDALLVLETADPRLALLVEMRYYGGYTEAEIAETMGVTERTVQRDWNKARLLLKAALQRPCADQAGDRTNGLTRIRCRFSGPVRVLPLIGCGFEWSLVLQN